MMERAYFWPPSLPNSSRIGARRGLDTDAKDDGKGLLLAPLSPNFVLHRHSLTLMAEWLGLDTIAESGSLPNRVCRKAKVDADPNPAPNCGAGGSYPTAATSGRASIFQAASAGRHSPGPAASHLSALSASASTNRKFSNSSTTLIPTSTTGTST